MLPVDVGFVANSTMTVTRSGKGNRNAFQKDIHGPIKSRVPEGGADTYIKRMRAVHQQARDAIDAAKTRMMEQQEGKRRVISFKVGQKVWLSAEGITLDVHRDRPSRKLAPVFYGPYRVTERISPVSYRLDLPASMRIHDVFHVHRLKAATESDFINRKPRKLPPVKNDYYEVSKIMADRTKYGHTEYLVRWKGYSLNESTWQRESDLKCPRILSQYLREKEAESH